MLSRGCSSRVPGRRPSSSVPTRCRRSPSGPHFPNHLESVAQKTGAGGWFVAGHDAVRQRLGDAPGEAFLQGLLDVQVRGVTALGDGLEGLAEGDLVEAVVRGGLGGELDHFLVAGGVGLAALGGGSAGGAQPSGCSNGRCRSGTGGVGLRACYFSQLVIL